MPSLKKSHTYCLVCDKKPARATYKYCSNECQQKHQFQDYIQKWQTGKIIGLSVSGIVSPQVKRYLRKKFKNKCCLCGWSKINPRTKRVPLIADHIDGNWKNNSESNLRLICPNCDSLTPNYKGNTIKKKVK